MIERLPGETDYEFHKRIVLGKLVDKTLSDTDYSELSQLVYGTDWSSDVTRKAMYGSLKTIELIERERERGVTISDDDYMAELERLKTELQEERQRLSDQRTSYRAMIRQKARGDEISDLIAKAIQSGKLRGIEDGDWVCSDDSESDCDLLISLNDIHYGACVQNAWRYYDSEVAHFMIAEYLDKIKKIQQRHNAHDCVVWANGDLISGFIHRSIDVSNKENVVEQVMGVSEMIASFLVELRKIFHTVRFCSVAGNHSRLVANKDHDLISERLDDLVAWYLSARLNGVSGIVIETNGRLTPTMYTTVVRGKYYVGVHGDFDLSPTSIQSLQSMVGRPVYAVLLGHLHHNASDVVQGIRTVMAGSFIGMDDFCIKKRIVANPEQTVCVCTEDGIECMYNVTFTN